MTIDGDTEEEEFKALCRQGRPTQVRPAKRQQPKRPMADYRFVRVPALWTEKLSKAKHAATFKLALHLLALEWENHDAPIKLSNGRLAAAGVSRRGKWRALRELESLGLILTERRSRKSPVVILLKHAPERCK
jgi:hypothetical protein